jgi:uncharacterized membrane protein YgcG
VSIHTTAPQTSSAILSHVKGASPWQTVAAILAVCFLICAIPRSRGQRLNLGLGATILIFLFMAHGCGGGGGSSASGGGGEGGGGGGGTQPGTPLGVVYTVTVTATSGQLSHDVAFQFTVQ